MQNETLSLLINESNTNERIAILLRNGYTQDNIIKILHVSSKTITKVKKAIDNGDSVPARGKKGQPTKKTPGIIAIVIEETVNNPRLPASAVQIIIAMKTGVDISVNKILEIRKEAGYYYSPPKAMPRLTDINIKKRISFCYSILKNRDIIPLIGFTDESRFCMGNDKRWVWVKRGEYNINAYMQRDKFPLSIMVWGMIAFGYKSKLLFVNGTLGADNYINLLDENGVIDDAVEVFGNDFVFQQDGAPAHNAKKTKEYLNEKCNVLINWPPNSPDLNVIEMIWAIMKGALADAKLETLEEFKTNVEEVWNNISIDTTINNLVNSCTMRCFLCLENGGNCINHLIKRNMTTPTDEQIQQLFEKCQADGLELEEIQLISKKK